jgi:hypothetical protein
MLNPWLTLQFQAVRFGWETQSVVVDQMMRLAGLGISDGKAAGNFVTNATAATGGGDGPEAQTSPVEAAAPAKSGEPRQVAQKVTKIEKKRSRGSKRRRAK